MRVTTHQDVFLHKTHVCPVQVKRRTCWFLYLDNANIWQNWILGPKWISLEILSLHFGFDPFPLHCDSFVNLTQSRVTRWPLGSLELPSVSVTFLLLLLWYKTHDQSYLWEKVYFCVLFQKESPQWWRVQWGGMAASGQNRKLRGHIFIADREWTGSGTKVVTFKLTPMHFLQQS